MLPVTVKGKEATFAVILLTVDTQFRRKDMDGSCDHPYPLTTPPRSSIDGKPPRRTVKKCARDAEE